MNNYFKKLISFLLIFSFMMSPLSVFASEIDDLWDKESVIPFDYLSEPEGNSVGENLYIFKGNQRDTTYLKNVYDYNTKTKEWAKKSTLPWVTSDIYRTYDIKSITYEKNIYVLVTIHDLSKDSLANSKLYVYETENDKWKEISTLSNRRQFAQMTIIEDKIYVLSGATYELNKNKYHQTMEIYNISDNTWEVKDLPSEITTYANFFAFTDNKDLFIVDSINHKVYKYENDNWIYSFNLYNDTENQYYYQILNSGVSINNKIFLLQGDRKNEENPDALKIVKFDLSKQNFEDVSEIFDRKIAFRVPHIFAGYSIYTFGGDINSVLSCYTGENLELPGEFVDLDGTGTESDPYQIKFAKDFYQIENDMTAYYILVDNIDLSGENFVPIGLRTNKAFSGSLNGNNYIIENLSIESNNLESVSMFVALKDAKITSLVFDTANIKTSNPESRTGLVAGTSDNTVFDYCLALNINIDSSSKEVGGLVANAKNTTFIGASVFGDIKSYDSDTGGLVSSAENSNFKYCAVISSIKSDKSVAGFASSMISSKINTSYSMSSLVAPNKWGLAKLDDANCVITEGYFDSTVSKITTPPEQAKITRDIMSESLFNIPQTRNPIYAVIFLIIVAGSAGVFYLYTFKPKELPVPENDEEPNQARLDLLVERLKDFVIVKTESFIKTTPIEVVILTDSSASMSKYRRVISDDLAQKLSDRLFKYDYMKVGVIDYNYEQISHVKWASIITDVQEDINMALKKIKDPTSFRGKSFIYSAIIRGMNGFNGSFGGLTNNLNELSSQLLSTYSDDIREKHIVVFTSGVADDTITLNGNLNAFVRSVGKARNIKIHFIEIDNKDANPNEVFKTIAEETGGVFNNINAEAGDIAEESQQAGNALSKTAYAILGEVVDEQLRTVSGVEKYTYTETDGEEYKYIVRWIETGATNIGVKDFPKEQNYKGAHLDETSYGINSVFFNYGGTYGLPKITPKGQVYDYVLDEPALITYSVYNGKLVGNTTYPVIKALGEEKLNNVPEGAQGGENAWYGVLGYLKGDLSDSNILEYDKKERIRFIGEINNEKENREYKIEDFRWLFGGIPAIIHEELDRNAYNDIINEYGHGAQAERTAIAIWAMTE